MTMAGEHQCRTTFSQLSEVCIQDLGSKAISDGLLAGQEWARTSHLK